MGKILSKIGKKKKKLERKIGGKKKQKGSALTDFMLLYVVTPARKNGLS